MSKYIARFIPIVAELKAGDRFRAHNGLVPIFMRLSNDNDGDYKRGHALIRRDKESPAEFLNIAYSKMQPIGLYLVNTQLGVGQQFLSIVDGVLCGGLITEDRGSTWKVGTAFDNIEVNKSNAFNIVALLNESVIDWVHEGQEFDITAVRIANKEEREEYPKARIKCGQCKSWH